MLRTSVFLLLLAGASCQFNDIAEVRGLLDQIQLETVKKLGLFDAEVTPKVGSFGKNRFSCLGTRKS